MNTLMLSWVAGHLCSPRYQCLLCSSGSQGYSAFRESLYTGYPEHTLLMTNVDIRDISDDPCADPVKTANPLLDDSSGVLFSSVLQVSSMDGWCDSLNPPSTYVALFSNVRYIPKIFMENCGYVKNIDLSGLTNIEEIREKFMNRSGITTIDLTPLTDTLRSVEGGFLSACTQLKSIDIAPLARVEKLPNQLLSNCSSITSIDLASMANRTTLPSSFLCFTGLTTIDLSPLTKLTALPPKLLKHCTKLKSVKLPPTLEHIDAIPYDFLVGCTSLTALNLAPLCNITTIGWDFLRGCTAIKKLDFTTLVHIKEFPSGFLSGCTGLTSIKFSGDMVDLTSIRRDFLGGTSLTTTDFSGFGNVTCIGDGFLKGCAKLVSIDLGPLHNLKALPEGFPRNTGVGWIKTTRRCWRKADE